MTKFTKEKLYTELSIQIATLEAKVDKILQLLMKPEIEYEIVQSINLSDNEEFDGDFK